VKKLLNGIIEFRQKYLPYYIENYSHLAQGQSPDVLLITCSDSRVAPHVFASTNPGDVFVVRNVGNIIPSFEMTQNQMSSAEAAAIEFALRGLPVKDIIVCGHSDCGAMRAILSGIDNLEDPHLRDWLKCAGCEREELPYFAPSNKKLVLHNQLSQMNVLQQIAHLKTYDIVQDKLKKKQLNIHGWYFDLSKGDVYNFEEDLNRFVLLDEEEALRILERVR
jgi:carbonic anhydrase